MNLEGMETDRARIEAALEYWTGQAANHPDPDDEGAPSRRRELQAQRRDLRISAQACHEALDALAGIDPELSLVLKRKDALESAVEELEVELAAAWADYEAACRNFGSGAEFDRYRSMEDEATKALVETESEIGKLQARAAAGRGSYSNDGLLDDLDRRREALLGRVDAAHRALVDIFEPNVRQLGKRIQELEQALVGGREGDAWGLPILLRQLLPEEHVVSFRPLAWCNRQIAELTAQRAEVLRRVDEYVAVEGTEAA